MLRGYPAPVLLTQQGLLGRLPQYAGRMQCLDRDWSDIATRGAAKSHQRDIRLGTSPTSSTPPDHRCPPRAPWTPPEHDQSVQWMWKAFPFGPGEICSRRPAEFRRLRLGKFSVHCCRALRQSSFRRSARRTSAAGRNRLAQVTGADCRRTPCATGCRTRAMTGGRLPRQELWVTSGEERCLPSFSLKEQIPESRLINLYGSSETPRTLPATETATRRTSRRAEVPIGRPIAKRKGLILDRTSIHSRSA